MTFQRLAAAAVLVLALGLPACGGASKRQDTGKAVQTAPPASPTVTTTPTTPTPPATSGSESNGPAPATTTPATGGTPSPSAGSQSAGGTGGVYPNRPPPSPGSSPNERFKQYCRQNPRTCGD